MRRTFLAIALHFVAVGAATAHDFWIQPDNFRPSVGTVVKVGLRVGDSFPGEAVERNSKRIVTFVAVGPGGEANVLGLEGKDPAGLWRPTAPGAYILAYRSNHVSLSLDAAKFEAYLKEEGLNEIIELRRTRGESDKPGREAYSRCAKAIVHVAGGESAATDATGFDHPLGLTLELIPEQDPAKLKPGDALVVRLMHDGRPLANAHLHAATLPDAETRITTQTDSEGRAKLTLTKAGVWRIAAVHMFPAPAGVDADWESLWACLTIEIRGTLPAAATNP